jgi:hypothetical protein
MTNGLDGQDDNLVTNPKEIPQVEEKLASCWVSSSSKGLQKRD